MVSFREIVSSLRQLNIDPSLPVIVHASPSSMDEIRGGAETALGALLSVHSRLMTPTFTFKTMIIPETGPDDNGIQYGSGNESNTLAEPFSTHLSSDLTLGSLAETIRKHPAALRSSHPILSFTGIQMESALKAQTIENPFAPIQALLDQRGWILLIGVNHAANVSIHFVEHLVGRKQFTRWALTRNNITECCDFPGCSNGFDQAAVSLKPVTRKSMLADISIQAVPIQQMVRILADMLHKNPLELLCDDLYCEQCNAVRRSISQMSG
jgi:aminoglycoside 3-N-acetyltransferase